MKWTMMTIICLVILTITYFLVFSKYEMTKSMFAHNISVTNKKFSLTISLSNSSKAITDYNYKVEGRKVFIQVQDTYITPFSRNRLGNVKVNVDKGSDELDQIYLKGNNNGDLKLIWSK